MCSACRRFLRQLPVAVACLLYACAGQVPDSHERLDDRYRLSPSALFHYRLPIGWTESSPRTAGNDVELWLVSDDGKQSLQVRIVRIDPGIRDGAGPSGDSLLVTLLYQLGRGGEAVGTDGLAVVRDGGRQWWTFHEIGTTGEVVTVSVFIATELIVEVRSVAVSGPGGEPLHREFVTALRW